MTPFTRTRRYTMFFSWNTFLIKSNKHSSRADCLLPTSTLARRKCSSHGAISSWLTSFLKLFQNVTASFKDGEVSRRKRFGRRSIRMNSSDPSEGIRASEIVPLIASRFEIRHFRYVGGTLLLLVFNEIAGNFLESDLEIMPLVDALITLDNFLIDNAVLPSYHVYMVCQKTENPLPMQTRNVLPLTAPIFRTTDLDALTISPRPLGLIAAEPNPFRADSQGQGQTTRVVDDVCDKQG